MGSARSRARTLIAGRTGISRRLARRRARFVLAGIVVAFVVGAIVGALSQSGPPPLPLPGIGRPARAEDPFSYIPGRDTEFAARATAGSAHVLFTKSPGGVLATAARVASFRSAIDSVTAGTSIDPD